MKWVSLPCESGLKMALATVRDSTSKWTGSLATKRSLRTWGRCGLPSTFFPSPSGIDLLIVMPKKGRDKALSINAKITRGRSPYRPVTRPRGERGVSARRLPCIGQSIERQPVHRPIRMRRKKTKKRPRHDGAALADSIHSAREENARSYGTLLPSLMGGTILPSMTPKFLANVRLDFGGGNFLGARISRVTSNDPTRLIRPSTSRAQILM